MPTIKNDTEAALHVVSHNNSDVWHYTELMQHRDGCPRPTCSTGQPFQESFATKAEALALIPEEYHVSSGAKEPDDWN